MAREAGLAYNTVKKYLARMDGRVLGAVGGTGRNGRPVAGWMADGAEGGAE